MTPQDTFLVLAPVVPAREATLRELLASMNVGAGRADATNRLLPFGRFPTLHFARLFLVTDNTREDLRDCGLPARQFPTYLALVGDVDGDGDAFLDELAGAASGLRELFGCCEGFAANTDLASWMREHAVRPAAAYVNWRGRTVRSVHDDAALYRAVERFVDEHADELKQVPAVEVHRRLRDFVEGERAAGRLPRTLEAPTPLRWSIANLAHLIGVPLVLLLASPLLLVIGVVFAVALRRLEKSDLELCQRADQAHIDGLAAIEDQDVSNQFSALGAVKPGIVRRWTLAFVLLIIDYTARHIYHRGRLARVRSIHFARWVWLDGRERMIFLSNYDGSHESYMDDFINKVAFGLNVVFSHGIGWPRTNWLVCDGCRDERKFKEYQRRHQLASQVWYKAYPGLSAVDLERHARVRDGLDRPSLGDPQAREWVALL